MADEAWIIDGVRSPRAKGKPGGSLHALHPQEIFAQVLNALVDRVGIDPDQVDDVVAGNGSNTGDHGDCIARLSVLAAEWPVETAGVTLNRFCGSGQQAVGFAAMGIQAGHQHAVVAGGVESMSHFDGMTLTLDAGNTALREKYPLVPQGISADLIATIEGFSREDVDAFGAESQARVERAREQYGRSDAIVPIKDAGGDVLLEEDEIPRAGTTAEKLAGLDPSFGKLGSAVLDGFDRSFDQMCADVYPDAPPVEHVHHAGNSSALADGASAILLTSPDFAKAHGLKPRAKVLMTAVAGAEPVIMLTAPGPASELCMKRASMNVDDIDLVEINEAFAAVPMNTTRELGLDPEKVNVSGGAIALGHPIGATGPMLIQQALEDLERRDKSTALITMCTGGGMGTATIIERI